MKNGPLTQCAGGLLFSDLANLADIARAFRVSEYSVELVPTLPSVKITMPGVFQKFEN